MNQKMGWDNILAFHAAERVEAGQELFSDPNNEADLVQAAQQGDLSAFNQLVMDYQDSLYGWVMSLVHEDALADDITQVTFVTAYEKILSFRGGSFRAWLFRIARNRSFDVMRRHKRHPSVSLDANLQEEKESGLLSVLPSLAPSPEEALIQSEETGRLLRLVDNLPEPFRHALVLVDLHEMDYLEAASILDLPVGTVKSRVARARQKLREEITTSSAA